MRTLGLTLPLLLAVGCPSYAAVEYVPDRDTLVIRDYAPERPCTPARLAQLDERFGWGKVELDATTDTCTVACNLQIGLNDGTSTHFQVGSEARPNATLVVRGTVRIHPIWLAGENERRQHEGE